MKIKNVWKLLIVVSVLLSFASDVSAQEGRGKGRIKGMIQDEAGNSIRNVLVNVTSLVYRNSSFETTSDERGGWVILGLGTGMWRVTVKAEGYYPSYQDIDVKQLVRNPDVNFTLKKMEATEMPMIKDESTLSLFEEGNQFFTEKKYDEAISSYQQFLQINQNAYLVHINIGNCYKEKGEYEKAREEFQIVLDRAKEEETGSDEITAKAMAAIGESYLKEQDFENAQKYFKNSIDIYPKDEALAYNVGEIYFSNSKVDEAIQYFELAKQIKPDWGKPYLKLGYAYLNKGDFEKAKENLKKFLEIDPESPDAPTVQNIIQFLEKQKKQASK